MYHSQRFIVSGLVAVGYSAAPLMNMEQARVFFGTPMSRRVAAGGRGGLAGIALVFWPKFGRLDSSTPLAIGAGLTAGAVLASCRSNLMLARPQTLSIRGGPPRALAMAYDAAASWLVVLLPAVPLQVRWSGAFAAALLYLALAGSVLAFGSDYALIGHIGAARAAYVGVMSKIVALLMSALFEGHDWTTATLVGIALAVAGNVLALSGQNRPRLVESNA